MALCPNCKKTLLEPLNKPNKTSEFFSCLGTEILVGMLVMSVITWSRNPLISVVLILIPILVVSYLFFRAKKDNPLSQCMNCEKVFDEETIRKAQRHF